jgi:hypothetical protein
MIPELKMIPEKSVSHEKKRSSQNDFSGKKMETI